MFLIINNINHIPLKLINDAIMDNDNLIIHYKAYQQHSISLSANNKNVLLKIHDYLHSILNGTTNIELEEDPNIYLNNMTINH